MRGTARRNASASLAPPAHRTTSSSPTSPARRLRPQWRLSPPFLAILVAGSFALSACGGGSSAATTSTSGATSAKASLAAYSACLQKHGVKLPDFGGGTFPTGGSFPGGGSFPTGGGGAFRTPAFQKASAACASLRPKGAFGGRRPGGNFSSTAFAAYRNCLKIHGVTLPTRPASGSSTSTSTTLTTNSTLMKKALADCASLRPKFTPRSGGGTTTTTS